MTGPFEKRACRGIGWRRDAWAVEQQYLGQVQPILGDQP
jgi:hypothetical protein